MFVIARSKVPEPMTLGDAYGQVNDEQRFGWPGTVLGEVTVGGLAPVKG